jgi:hypothetical protein
MHDVGRFRAAITALAEYEDVLRPGAEFIHIKTWTKYRVLCTSLREHDLVPVVTYFDPTPTPWRKWTRPCAEFVDPDRFTPTYRSTFVPDRFSKPDE